MSTLFSLTISNKLRLLAASTVLGIIVITIICLVNERYLILEEHKASVQKQVEVVYGLVAYFQSQAAAGKLTEDEAKRQAINQIRPLRYGDNNYFFIGDMQGHFVLHSTQPDLEGTDSGNLTDPSGKHFFTEMVSAVKDHGQGFVEYGWKRAGASTASAKISYVKGFAPWGWFIGSGDYVDNADVTFWHQFILFSIGGFFLNGALVIFSLFIGFSITRPLNRAVEIAKTVASGDLTSEIDPVQPKDEIGVLFNALREMNQNLVQIVTEVRADARTIATSASEISAGNMDLSERTEAQASSLEETAATMEQLTSTVKQNSDNADGASRLAASASDVAVKGKVVIGEVVETMSAINESSRKVVDIISVIDGIAFQTNILALNAAVEAARAGEQGRGFAVVASEVRHLAQRSASAAKEIKGLIDNSVERVELGARLVDDACTTMDEIVSGIASVSDIMKEITSAGHEQRSGIEQVNQAITEMDAVTQQNAALVEQAAAASVSLQENADNLTRVVSVFRLTDTSPQTKAAGSAARREASAAKPAKAAPVKATAITKPAARTAIAAQKQSKKLSAPATAASDGWEEF